MWTRLVATAVGIFALSGPISARAQVQHRTIRWGHLNNSDHPVSFGARRS